MRGWLWAMLLGLAVGCASERTLPTWDGRVEVHGALRAMFHSGQTGRQVGLDELPYDPHRWAVGALADLDGEVTMASGTFYLAHPRADGSAQYRRAAETDRGATLLVHSSVPAWTLQTVDRALPFEAIELYVLERADAAGVPTDGAFPFRLLGEIEHLQLHVIDGSRLKGGGSSHHDHLEAAIRTTHEKAKVTLVGFYGPEAEGLFTHMGSRVHLHAIFLSESDRFASGHVDHAVIPAGTVLALPNMHERYGEYPVEHWPAQTR